MDGNGTPAEPARAATGNLLYQRLCTIVTGDPQQPRAQDIDVEPEEAPDTAASAETRPASPAASAAQEHGEAPHLQEEHDPRSDGPDEPVPPPPDLCLRPETLPSPPPPPLRHRGYLSQAQGQKGGKGT